MFNSTVTGVEFRKNSLSAVMVQKKRGSHRVISSCHYEFPHDIFADTTPNSYQDCVNKLIQIKNNQPLFKHCVAIVIPELAVMSKTVATDSRLKHEQQRAIARHQFMRNNQYQEADLCFDYWQQAGKVEIFAAKREVIESRTRLIKQAGMKTILVESEGQTFQQLMDFGIATTPYTSPLLVELYESVLMVGNSKSFSFQAFPLVKSLRDGCSLLSKIRKLIAEQKLPEFDVIWLCGSEAKKCIPKPIEFDQDIMVQHFPVEAENRVKGSWVAQSSYCCTKAFGTALSGINALERGYAA